MPAGITRVLGNPKVAWQFFSEPEAGLKGRKVFHPRGRVLGGTSAINGMAYIRGHAADYDGWRQAGNVGWGWDDVLPYFRKSEGNRDFSNEHHSDDGELGVSRATLEHPTSRAFLDAAIATGIPATEDFNDGRSEGAGWLQFTIDGGRRSSTARAFLDPARTRSNLAIKTEALVDRILFEGRRATGVRYKQGGTWTEAKARREIILSCGAYQSPQVLMRSGIGDPNELFKHGIDVLQCSPDVGQNLQDHIYASHMAKTQQKRSINHQIRGPRLVPQVIRYALTRKGHLSLAVSNACVFTSVMPGVDIPDIQIMFRPLSLGRGANGDGLEIHDFPGLSASVTQLRPRSRGVVALHDAQPESAPKLVFNYLQDPYDVQVMVAGFRKVLEIYQQAPLNSYKIGMIQPASEDMDDDEIEAFIRQYASTVYHPVGTCRMGADDGAVVDPRLKVKGLKGLRVADASIMPTLIGGNTNAPSIMIGEKCADMVLEDNKQQLAAE